MNRKSGNRFSLATNAERVCAEIMLKQRASALIRRETPNLWRYLARLGRPLSVKASVSHLIRAPRSCSQGSQSALRSFPRSSMQRDDLIFWLSLVWFLFLCGAAAWAFVWL